MTDFLTNRLYFRTNAKTILIYLKSKSNGKDSPAQFSLNSVKQMPSDLMMPLLEPVKTLSLMNIELPEFKDEKLKTIALDKLFAGQEKKQPEGAIRQQIDQLRKTVKKAEDRKIFDQAVANYDRFQFFSYYDWRLTYWGTSEDIHSVVPDTFIEPTGYIEFQTYCTPPLQAIQLIVNAFPSVRFHLHYRYRSNDPWSLLELFPFPPFGY